MNTHARSSICGLWSICVYASHSTIIKLALMSIRFLQLKSLLCLNVEDKVYNVITNI